jgi:hypothetical protein
MGALRLKGNKKRTFLKKRKEVLKKEKMKSLREEEQMRSSISLLEDPIMFSQEDTEN